MPKLTRVCRRCRKPQLIDDLKSLLEGSTERYVCVDSCQPHWARQSTNEVATVTQPESNELKVLDILDGYLEGTISNFDIKIKKDGDTFISKVVENQDEVSQESISYQGIEEVIQDGHRPHFITTSILGEKIDQEFLSVIKYWALLNDAYIHIFFKKVYVRDEEFLNGTLQLLLDKLEGTRVQLHMSNDLMINNQCEVRASANVHHTAIAPTSKVKLLAKTDYFVVPHARQEIEVTVNKSRESRSVLASTGCINDLRKGHTQSLAQIKAHSVKGGLIYRPAKDYGYGLTPINFDGSGFYEYNQYYNDLNSFQGYADTIVLSDLHCSMIDQDYLELMKKDITNLQPLQVVAGDVMDNQSLCYHEQDRLGYSQARLSFSKELAITMDVVRQLHDACPSSNFVALDSNHDKFITKYFSNPSNFKTLNREDCVLAHRTIAHMIETTELREGGVHYGNPMEYLYSSLISEGWFKFTADERFDIDLNSHGDEYGTRNLGTTSNIKSIMGHVHTPSQRKGVIRVGSSQVPNPEYQTGLNNSAPALCILHSNGKRQLLIHL